MPMEDFIISVYCLVDGDERESLWELIDGVHGMIIADKGLIGADYQHELRQLTGINLQTAVRSNMAENRNPAFLKWLVSTRRLVETVTGQLTDRFNIEKVRARKLWYLTNRIARNVMLTQFIDACWTCNFAIAVIAEGVRRQVLKKIVVPPLAATVL